MSRDQTGVACLRLEPFALHLLRHGRPDVPLAALDERGRVLSADAAARRAGVTPGLRLHAAVSRCPDLHAEHLPAPRLAGAWAETLDALHLHSPRVEDAGTGRAYLTLTGQAARELATALGAGIGRAESREVALLAALGAARGEVREVVAPAEAAFLARVPVAHLTVLGLPERQIERLTFLGLNTLGDLGRWSAAQRRAFLGEAAAPISRLLRGERSRSVALYRPREVLEASLGVETPMRQPGEWAAAVRDLTPGLHAALAGRTTTYLTLRALTPLGWLTGTRRLKEAPSDRSLARAADQLLLDFGKPSLEYGVERLVLELSGLAQPARQVGLWPSAHDLNAGQAVLERYPRALVRLDWLDPDAYVFDARYRWVGLADGEVRELPNAPQGVFGRPEPTGPQAVMA